MTHFIPYTSYATFEGRFNVEHEFDELGSHKIIIDGHMGLPALWSEIAYLDYNGWRFCGTTEHFWPALPEIFLITEIKGRTLGGALEEELLEVEDSSYMAPDLPIVPDQKPLVKRKMHKIVYGLQK